MHSGCVNTGIEKSFQNNQAIDDDVDEKFNMSWYPIELQYAVFTNQYVHYYSGHPADHETSLEIMDDNVIVPYTIYRNFFFALIFRDILTYQVYIKSCE